MIEKEIIDRITGIDQLGENCNYVFHDAELRCINYQYEDEGFNIVLKVKHWKHIGDKSLDVIITFKLNNVRSYQMDNNSYPYALELYFEKYDGLSQGCFDDCMLVSSDMGFSIVCKTVDISVEEIE